MRSKNILSIAAFAIAFSLSTVLASFFVVKTYQTTTYGISDYSSTCSKRHNLYQSETATQIAVFIQADKENGYERDRKLSRVGNDFRPAFESSTFSAYTEVVEEYVDDSSSLDASELPLELKTAWREHMKAWRDYSDFLSEIKDSAARKKMETEELLSLDNEHSNEINRTWFEVLRIGRKHGADVY